MINNALLLSLISLTFLSIITPGPSNLMMMSSSALFGWRKTVPLYLGINFGSAVLVTASVYGLGAVLDRWPWLLFAAKSFGTLWLAFLSVKFFKNAFSSMRTIRASRNLKQCGRFDSMKVFFCNGQIQKQ